MIDNGSGAPPRTPSWKRFSLRGLFLFTLVLAGMLAGWRLKEATWVDGPRFALVVLLILGLLGEIVRHARKRAFLDAIGSTLTPLAAVVLCVASLAARFAVDAEHPWFTAPDSLAIYVAAPLMEAALFLGVWLAYYQPVQPASLRSPWIAALRGSIIWLTAGGLLAYFACEATLVGTLVHIAIHGVELAQPTRLAGREFVPARLETELQREFVANAAWAALALAGAVAAMLVVGRSAGRSSAAALAGFAVWAMLMVVVWRLLEWCGTTALPRLAPIMAPYLWAQPVGNWSLGGAIGIVGSGVVAHRLTGRPKDSAAGSEAIARAGTPFHRHWIVLTAFAATMLYTLRVAPLLYALSYWRHFSWWWPVTSLADIVGHPPSLIQALALVAVALALWRTWRGNSRDCDVLRLRPVPFLIVWVMCAATACLAILTLGWAGPALLLWSAGP